MLKALQSMQKPVSVKNMIHKKLAGWDEPRPHGKIHASDLLKDKEFCPREWAFLDLGIVKKKAEFIGTAMQITFTKGRDLEFHLRNDWLREHVVGFWKCGVCGHMHEFGKAPKIKCPQCGWGHKWEYEEPRATCPVTGVSGGIDLLLDVSQQKLLIVELKTMDKDQHKDLKAPLAEHKLRTSLYLHLVDQVPELRDRVNTKKAMILYASKSYGFKDESLAMAGIKDSPFSPFKEFEVVRDDSLFQYPLLKAQALTVWREMYKNGSTQGLPCGVCPNGLGKRAQQCSAVGPCFSGQFLSTITWMENGKPKHPGKGVVVGSQK